MREPYAATRVENMCTFLTLRPIARLPIARLRSVTVPSLPRVSVFPYRVPLMLRKLPFAPPCGAVEMSIARLEGVGLVKDDRVVVDLVRVVQLQRLQSVSQLPPRP